MAARMVLQEAIWDGAGGALWVKRALLVMGGVAALALAAKITVPMWPVPATMQTFVVLSIGAAYGLRLGVVTLAAYLAVGLMGFDVFTGSSAERFGWAYMVGATGGYLVGFLLATALMGALARRGWDRSMGGMALAMLAGTGVIYLLGLGWMGALFAEAQGWAWVVEKGMVNFLLFDALKLVLAALLFPALWRMVGSARS